MKNFPVCCSRPRSISLCDIFKRGYLISQIEIIFIPVLPIWAMVCLQFRFTANGLLYRFPHVCSLGVLKTREKYGRVYRFDISKIPMSLE